MQSSNQTISEADYREPAPKLTELLERLIKLNGSDLHITTNTQPRMRINGDLEPLPDYPILTAAETKPYAYSVMSEKQISVFEDRHELDLSFGIQGLSRFRVNVFDQRNGIGVVFRAIPFEVVPLDRLKLPPPIIELCDKPNGLVLVTGPTGSGKSTTLASLLDKINRERPVHILTIEDPIEFIHGHKRGCVNQREIGPNTASFPDALRTALRQDPDIVLIGELRDLETIESALRIAETGHLTFATLHTNTASSTITRIIDVFPDWRQDQVRVQLAASLGAIIAQRLIPKVGGGRVAAFEVLVANHPVRNLIREGKSNQLMNVMTTNQSDGMCTMETSLASLIRGDVISYEDALEVSAHPKEIARAISNLGRTAGRE